jgi:purine-binding chemotaxis protein CheW
MHSTGARPDRAAEAAEHSKYLTFKLADEEYGLEILKVREIIGIMDITSVPQMPDYVRGVVNLRGRVIPVIDLRLKFGMPAIEYTSETCIIVVDGGAPMGVIVDTVQEVLDIAADQIAPPPPLGKSVQTDFILGMGKVKEQIKILVHIDRVLSDEQICEIQEASQG